MYELKPSKLFLTPSFILSKISEEDIFTRYLCPVTDDKICNPMREDHNPTCNFFKGSGGRIMFVDYRGDFFGDCFQVVQYQYGLTFHDALNKIAKDFGIVKGASDNSTLLTVSVKDRKPSIPATIQVKRQDWTETDKIFWKSFGLNSKILSKFNVASCEFVWVNNNIVYSYSSKDPAYCYYFGDGNYKIYFPFRDLYRFIGNTTTVQGFQQLPQKEEILVITKSLKDVMVLDLFNIPAIAPQAESIIISTEMYLELKNRFKNIFTLYDFDKAGCKSAFKMWREYQIPMLFLTNGRYNTRNYGAKDISDYIYNFGKEQTLELIKETYNIVI